MTHIKISVILLTKSVFIRMIIAQSSACLSNDLLLSYGFIQSPVVVTQSSVCKSYYNNNGSCVNTTKTVAYLSAIQSWYKNQSVNAHNYVNMYKNVSVFWQVVNGYLQIPTLSIVLPAHVTSILVAITADQFNNANLWIQNLQQQAQKAIDPCFQTLANITNGIYCGLTSNNSFSQGSPDAEFPHSISMTLQGNASTIGPAMSVCLPLIDNYCTLSFGVSIYTQLLPFNLTFNWTDHGLQLADCLNFQAIINCTTPNCTSLSNGYLTSMFYTNWIPFIPSTNSIDNLGNYLSSFSNTTAFAPPNSRPVGKGIKLNNSTVFPAEDFYLSGLNSGMPVSSYLSSVVLTSALVLFSNAFFFVRV